MKKRYSIKRLDPNKKGQKKKNRGEGMDSEDGKGKKNMSSDYSSIIYVSRLPNGFHEKELSKYFNPIWRFERGQIG